MRNLQISNIDLTEIINLPTFVHKGQNVCQN